MSDSLPSTFNEPLETVDPEIAAVLDLQVVTMKLHMKGILRKLGAANRTHAVKIVLDLRSAA